MASYDAMQAESTTVTTTGNPVNLVFTDSAAEKVYTLIQEEGNPALKLRVFITGGGCSGFQYGFAFEETMNEDDWVVEKQVAVGKQGDKVEEEDDDGGDGSTVKLLVDPISFNYLAGAEIDYRKDLQGEQFIIRNPNAKTTCGCGSSFAV